MRRLPAWFPLALIVLAVVLLASRSAPGEQAHAYIEATGAETSPAVAPGNRELSPCFRLECRPGLGGPSREAAAMVRWVTAHKAALGADAGSYTPMVMPVVGETWGKVGIVAPDALGDGYARGVLDIFGGVAGPGGETEYRNLCTAAGLLRAAGIDPSKCIVYVDMEWVLNPWGLGSDERGPLAVAFDRYLDDARTRARIGPPYSTMPLTKLHSLVWRRTAESTDLMQRTSADTMGTMSRSLGTVLWSAGFTGPYCFPGRVELPAGVSVEDQSGVPVVSVTLEDREISHLGMYSNSKTPWGTPSTSVLGRTCRAARAFGEKPWVLHLSIADDQPVQVLDQIRHSGARRIVVFGGSDGSTLPLLAQVAEAVRYANGRPVK